MIVSFATLKPALHTVAFQVNAVEPANRLLKAIKYQQAVETHLGKVEAGSVKEFLGISQNQATMAIRPKMSWAIVGKKSSK
ncbi:MAG: hypothetical protein HC877_20825 [Thioploca sp.]|nr:hypothetical protein [Thioploca sp.]